ncbi:MAG: type II toxin-antitoxin system HigB family toxin [Bacteroidales bacterium]|nr:type II toxin-antitoxin system HigB family toxin [Bacteroidales bacterium]
MKRVFAKSTLRRFWENHTDSEQYLKTWYDTVLNSSWSSPNDIKGTYSNASILRNGRVVFNIKGHSYRLVVRFNFEKQWAFIRFIGTRADYATYKNREGVSERINQIRSNF